MKCPHCHKPIAIAAEENFYTTAQAAVIAGVSAQTVINWSAAGHFPGPRIGTGRRHILKRPFLEYLAPFEVPAAKAELLLLDMGER